MGFSEAVSVPFENSRALYPSCIIPTLDSLKADSSKNFGLLSRQSSGHCVLIVGFLLWMSSKLVTWGLYKHRVQGYALAVFT
jgi:hypothetical protein